MRDESRIRAETSHFAVVSGTTRDSVMASPTRLEVPPQGSLVFEDTGMGIQAATAS